MINIKSKLSFLDKLPFLNKTEENPNSSAFNIEKIQPKKKFIFCKVISFCIEETSIQMATSLHLGKKIKILDVTKEYIPKNNFDGAQIKSFISDHISDYVIKNSSHGTRVVIALSGQETIFRTFLMPELNNKDLKTALDFEVDKQIPYPVEDCNYDFRQVYKIRNNDQKRIKITLHATSKQDIYKQLKPFNDLSIPVFSIYHAQDVIGQLLQFLTKFDESESYTLLNIGKTSTEISFYKGTTLEFSHSSSLTSEMLWDNNDKSKFEYFAESIANEIQNSLDYYAGQYTTAYNNNIYVYGDFAYSAELFELINTKGGIKLKLFPVEMLRFLSKEQVETPEVFTSGLTVLAAAANNGIIADLLPAEEKVLKSQNRVNNYIKAAILIIAGLFMMSWMAMNNVLNIKNSRLNEINYQVELFKNSEGYHTYNVLKREIAFNQDYLEKIKESPSYYNLNLKELSNVTPKEVKLIHLSFDPSETDENLFIQGIVTSDNVPPEIILAEFIENLSSSPFYENVKLIRHIKKEVKGNFNIEFHLNLKGIS